MLSGLLRIVRLATRLIDSYGEQAPPQEDHPRLAHLIWRLRPVALVAAESEVQRAVEKAANRFLTEKSSNLFEREKVNAATHPRQEQKTT